MKSNKAIFATIALLASVLALFECTNIDLAIQDCFYNFAEQRWLVSDHDRLLHFWFYDLPKVLLWLFVLFLFWKLAWPPRWPRELRRRTRRHAQFLLACIICVPGTVSILKKTTGVLYPYKIERYGGTQPYRNLIASIPRVPGQPRGRGWPAGHASGGFALMGLYFVGRTRRERLLGLGLGLGSGWTLGTYQMLRGTHYMSHTVVSMLLGWLIIQCLARIMHKERRPRTPDATRASPDLPETQPSETPGLTTPAGMAVTEAGQGKG